jgi:NAD(P)-dependent dehydrogenase (short-subunit alcohol dehydrogenase family)
MAGEGTVIVTGGSRGIGAAVCRKLAAMGHPVAVNYTANPGAAQALVESIRKAGGKAQVIAADVAESRRGDASLAACSSTASTTRAR